MNTRRIRRKLTQLARDFVDRTGWTERQVHRGLGSLHPGEATHVLIAPPGAGNIGDQAMVEAFIAAADRPVAVVTRGAGDFVLPADLADRASLHPLPHLFYGQGAQHRADLSRLGELLGGAATVSIVGADIMDGVYVLRSSLRRSAIAAACAAGGIDTSVIGFSWNGAAPAAALEALRRAGAAGARLLLRDPASASRVRDAGVAGVVETADIVFTDDRCDDAAAVEILRDVNGPFVLVNASGLIARKVDQVPEYETLVSWLRARGLSVVLLPHVLRDTADDLTACRAVFDRVGGDGVVLVDRALSPSAIRGLTARAALAVTGRMHLAIMSLAQGTPAITLATQGKVEGLMRLFEWPELCVSPRAGMAEEIIRVADVALTDGDSKERVRRGAERARELASANVSRIHTMVTGVGNTTSADWLGGRDG
jgi:polysaccharide pyruvyl transferase WcaK-like protein